MKYVGESEEISMRVVASGILKTMLEHHTVSDLADLNERSAALRVLAVRIERIADLSADRARTTEVWMG